MAHPKILIVDDDEDLQILYGLFLQGESFEILRAVNGKQALELVASQSMDLIILDMIMPVMDGEEFLKKFSSMKESKTIPIIIASVNDKIPPQLFEEGIIQGTLKKPFTMETFISKIQEVLSHRSKK